MSIEKHKKNNLIQKEKFKSKFQEKFLYDLFALKMMVSIKPRYNKPTSILTFKKTKKKRLHAPIGLNSIQKRRIISNSLWFRKFERQKKLYKNKDVPWAKNFIPQNSIRWIYIDVFKQLQQIGSGVYGSVYHAQAPTGTIIALKYLRLERETEGLPITAIREISLLKRLNHMNVIKLLDVVTSTYMKVGARRHSDIYLVLEWCDHDLARLLSKDKENKKNGLPTFFSEALIKEFMSQIISAFSYLHNNMGTIHRDLKPANILLTKSGVIKIADFGLARIYSNKKALTNEQKIVTRWYRSPELLLECRKYDYSIDMWSIGCVFGELIVGSPLFPATSELKQLSVVLDYCGPINEITWPDHKQFRGIPKAKLGHKRRLKSFFRKHVESIRPCWNQTNVKQTLNLLDQLLTLDPKQRIKARIAQEHIYFKCAPLPMKPRLSFEHQNKFKYIQTLKEYKKNKKLKHI